MTAPEAMVATAPREGRSFKTRKDGGHVIVVTPLPCGLFEYHCSRCAAEYSTDAELMTTSNRSSRAQRWLRDHEHPLSPADDDADSQSLWDATAKPGLLPEDPARRELMEAGARIVLDHVRAHGRVSAALVADRLLAAGVTGSRVGALFSALASTGVLVEDGRHVPGPLPGRAATPVTMWRLGRDTREPPPQAPAHAWEEFT